MKKRFLSVVLTTLMLFSLLSSSGSLIAQAAESPWFELQVVDAATGKGIANAEVVRNGLIRFVTDSYGRVAIIEPDFMNQRVYFDVLAEGYDTASSNPMTPGAFVDIVPGGKRVIKLNRKSIAEPAYRITGSGIFKDSAILGYNIPVSEAYSNAGVMVMENFTRSGRPLVSCGSVIYKGKVYWFYNGLRGMSFSQKNNRMAVAVSELSGSNSDGVELKFITGNSNFPKEMAPFGSKSDIVWFDSVMTVSDSGGKERLVAHYTLYDSSIKQKEHGLALYDDDKEVFEKLKVIDSSEKWRYPVGRTFKQESEGKEWIYFGEIFPIGRVPATLDAIQNHDAYEVWSCYEDGETSSILRNKKGELVYRWTKKASPVGPAEEQSLIRRKIIDDSEAMFLPKDETGKDVTFQSGSVRYNPYKKKWVFIGTQFNGKPSRYGEVWYSEAFRPTGPWEKAVKVVSHENYSLFNTVHHDFLNEGNGKVIYFEGTYTNDLSSNALPRMMYNNNRLMYRIQLDDQRIKGVFAALKDKPLPVPDETPADETPGSDETPGKDKTPGIDETPGSDKTPDDKEPGSDQSPKQKGDKDDNKDVPKTGDPFNYGLVILAAFCGILTVSLALLSRKKVIKSIKNTRGH